ncbi:hypothetical protein D3C86_2111530 [compost metagenome]
MADDQVAAGLVGVADLVADAHLVQAGIRRLLDGIDLDVGAEAGLDGFLDAGLGRVFRADAGCHEGGGEQ